MRWTILVGSMLAVAIFYWYQVSYTGNIPAVSQPAPDFHLPDQGGKMRALSDYRGKWLVLYFYPKDDTPFCTDEACSFRDDIAKIHALGAEVVGISVDDVASHAQFSAKNKLPFAILADPEMETVKNYGVLMNLLAFRIAKRYTFLIDPEGKIAGIYQNVTPKQHSREVIQDLNQHIKK